MAALREDNTFVSKVLEDFDGAIRRMDCRGGDFSGSSSSGLMKDHLAKRLIFDDDKQENAKASGEMETKGKSCTTASTANNQQQRKSSDSVLKRKWDGELLSARTKIIRLENLASSLQTEMKQNKIDFDAKLEEMNASLWREKEIGREMQLKLKQVLDREEERRVGFEKCREQLKTKMMNYREKSLALKKENEDLRNELSEHMTDTDTTIFNLKSDLQRKCAENDLLKIQLENLEQQLQNYSTKSMNVVEQMRISDESMTKAKEADRRVKELELELSKHEDSIKLTRILQNQLSKLPDLERENRKLKEENRIHRMRDENVLLLNEKLDAAKSALERSERLCADLPKCRLENDDLRQKLNDWEKLLSLVDKGQIKSPQNVAKAILRLQQQETLLLEKVGTLTTNNNALQAAQSAVDVKLRETDESMQRLDKLVKRHSDQVRNLQRKLLLVAKERDFYRQLVDNYEKETTMFSTSSSTSSHLVEDDKVHRLESLVEGYKKSVDSLEVELEQAHQQLTKFGHNSGFEVEEERRRLELEIKKLLAKVSTSEDRVRQLTEEKAALEVQVEYFTLKGEINPQKTRVVHLSSNPVAWERQLRTDELDRLKKENDNLRLRIKLLEEAGGNVEDLTIQVGERLKDVPSAKDVEAMREQLCSAELKNKRLVEAFRKLSVEFREVAYTLLGYKLELPCNNQFKFTSIYAESEDHYLLFEKADSGEVQLLETPYSTDIADKIQIYLHTYHSIPAFLSHLTLELFNSQTTMASSSSMDITNL